MNQKELTKAKKKLNLHPLEVESRFRDPHYQVNTQYLHLYNLSESICQVDKFNPYSAGIDCRRQILLTKVNPRTVRVKIFLMAVDP